MSLLIINADDFGYSKGINLGIIESHSNGVLTSTTMLSNMPGFDHAVKLAEKHPDLGIGVHLTLTNGSPLLDTGEVSSLTNNGKFHKITFYEEEFSINKEEVYREWQAQIEKIIHAGIQPTHLDSHHHVNRLPDIKEVFVQLAQEYNLPVRNNFMVPNSIKSVNRFFTEFDDVAMKKEIWKPMSLKNLIQDCKNYETVEIMCHPGYIDSVVYDNSGLQDMRAYTCAELQKPVYKKAFADNNIQLGTYKEISNRHN